MDERLRHTDAERAAASEGIDAIRAQLGHPRTVPHPGQRQHTEPESGLERETVELPHLQAEMAWGAERERLHARIVELETERDHLRNALAAILHHAADAVTRPPTLPAHPTAPTDPAID